MNTKNGMSMTRGAQQVKEGQGEGGYLRDVTLALEIVPSTTRGAVKRMENARRAQRMAGNRRSIIIGASH